MTASLNPEDGPRLADDVALIAGIEAITGILDIICRTTGMGFVAVARVTDERWIACAVRDDIGFGLEPGGELELKTTLCDEIRDHREPIVIDDVAKTRSTDSITRREFTDCGAMSRFRSFGPTATCSAPCARSTPFPMSFLHRRRERCSGSSPS